MSAVVNIARYMYTLFEYKTKYQEEEVTKIKSMLFQAIADYTLRKSEKASHTKRHYVDMCSLTCENNVSVAKKCVQEYFQNMVLSIKAIIMQLYLGSAQK